MRDSRAMTVAAPNPGSWWASKALQVAAWFPPESPLTTARYVGVDVLWSHTEMAVLAVLEYYPYLITAQKLTNAER
jgi:hypothetical protein